MACESCGRHILALEEERMTFNRFFRDIEVIPKADMASLGNQVLSLQQHLDDLDGHSSQVKGAMIESSQGVASLD